MPLPTDEKLIALAKDILAQFDQIFGLHPGFRPAHAKGILLEGTFRPSEQASSLSRAPHFNQPSTVILVRFSNSTGLPQIPDNNANADPRGMAIRFLLGEHVHTDIVSHATDGFPTRNGQDFLDFLRAAAASDPVKLAGSALEAFFQSHPETLRFVQTPKPAPASFAQTTYFGVTAMQFTNSAGASQFGRYRIVPEAGNEFIDQEALKTKGQDYLIEEIQTRLARGPARFKLNVQLASDGDIVDNATEHWPQEREVRELGTMEIAKVVDDNEAQQKRIIFDPIPRVDGIEPSNDPLLELRAGIYLISGRRRRAA